MPNLDFRIEQGDSLTGPNLTSELQPNMFQENIFELAKEIQELKKRYSTAREGDRQEIREQIEFLEQKILAAEPGVSIPKGAFDWRIKFVEVFKDKGFDIVLANPPYVKAGAHAADKNLLRSVFGDLSDGSADIYVYFYYRALQILKSDGILAIISSDKWVKSSYGIKLRHKLWSETDILTIVDFGFLPVFQKAKAYPLIIVAQKGHRGSSTWFSQVPSLDPPYPDVKRIVMETGAPLNPSAINREDWILCDPETYSTIRQMETVEKRLSDYLEVPIKSGIKTGCNEAFIIDQPTHDRLTKANPNNGKILRLLYTGKDITKWTISDQAHWLIFTPSDLDRGRFGLERIMIEDYPEIYDYLLSFIKPLKNRGDSGTQWWQLRECEYYPLIFGPKIIFQEIATYSRFAFDPDGVLVNNKVHFIPGEDPYLLGILNSKWAWMYFKVTCPPLDSGTISLQTPNVVRLPIPDANQQDREAIIDLVQQCMDASESQRTALEAEIDERVGRLYGIH